MNRSSIKNPREISFNILCDYSSSRDNLKMIINRHIKNIDLKDRDRRFIYGIVKGTVRNLIKIDYLVSLFSRIKVENLDIEVINILRLSIYQLMFLDRIPGYSIVNESVNIAKKRAGLYSSKFVNAILRKIAKIKGLVGYTDKEIEKNIIDDEQRIGLKKSFPAWLVKYWIQMYGNKIIEKLLGSFNEPSPNYIRINNLVTDKEKLVGLFTKNKLLEGRDFKKLSANENQLTIFKDTITLKSFQDIKNIAGYDEGMFSIQDYSSQFAVRYFLKPEPGEKILDICGAPGGKATYAAEITKNKCEIVSVDINDGKLRLFEENIKRLKTGNISIIKSDVTRENYLGYGNYFDKIFIDCPCSALGTISKNPDVKYNKSIKDIKRLSNASLKILNNCKKYLNREKGKIIFYTCTLSNIENQDVIARFIKNNSTCFVVKTISLPDLFYKYFSENDIPINKKSNYFEIMPYFFNSEGGFITEIYSKN